MAMQPDPLDYSTEVRRRFDSPSRHGRLFGSRADTRRGMAGDVRQGVRVAFEARVRDGRIADCRFRAYGCPHVIAAASWVAEHAVGRAADDPAWPDPRALHALLEAPAHKLGSLLVVEDAWRACMAAPPAADT
jgi:hypothetical protein